MPVVIKDLLPMGKSIPVGRGSLEVWGLSVDSLAKLIAKYKEEVYILFSGETMKGDAVLSAAPDMVVDAIAMASDSVGQEKDIRKIPVTDQIALLAAIIELTVPDAKKLRESLSGVVAALSLSEQKALPES